MSSGSPSAFEYSGRCSSWLFVKGGWPLEVSQAYCVHSSTLAEYTAQRVYRRHESEEEEEDESEEEEEQEEETMWRK